MILVSSTCLLKAYFVNQHLRHFGSLAVSCRFNVRWDLCTETNINISCWNSETHGWFCWKAQKQRQPRLTDANHKCTKNNPIHVNHTIKKQNISGSYVCSQVYSKFYTPNVCGKPMFNSVKPSVICGVLEIVLEPTAVPAHWPKPRNPWWCWSSLQWHPKLEIAKLLDAIQCKLWLQKVIISIRFKTESRTYLWHVSDERHEHKKFKLQSIRTHQIQNLKHDIWSDILWAKCYDVGCWYL